MKNKQPKRKTLDPKGGLWYRELKALNYPLSKQEEAAAQKVMAPRKYRERLPYVIVKGGRKASAPYERICSLGTW